MAQNASHTTVIYPASVTSLKRTWTYSTAVAIESSPVVIGGVVYIGSRDHQLYALDARTGKKLWSYMTNGAIFATAAVGDDIVYGGSNDHSLYAFDQTSFSSEEPA